MPVCRTTRRERRAARSNGSICARCFAHLGLATRPCAATFGVFAHPTTAMCSCICRAISVPFHGSPSPRRIPPLMMDGRLCGLTRPRGTCAGRCSARVAFARDWTRPFNVLMWSRLCMSAHDETRCTLSCTGSTLTLRRHLFDREGVSVHPARRRERMGIQHEGHSLVDARDTQPLRVMRGEKGSDRCTE